MILKTESGTLWAVHFRHIGTFKADVDMRTEASIHVAPCESKDRPCGTVAFKGVAYCNPFDRFVKEKGRKLALSRAMENIPRAERGEIWRAYFNRDKQ